MKKRINVIILSIIFISCQAQQNELKLNLEKGKEYKQTTISKTTVIQDINGQKMDIKMTIKGTMSFLVDEIHDNDYKINVKYDNLSLSMELPQGVMEFSSEKNDKQDIFSMILAEMKKGMFQINLTKNGKITDIKNIESLFDPAFNKFPQIPEKQIVQIKSQLMKAYGKEAFKGNIEMITAIYPNKPVFKGDSWEIKTKLESGMSADMTTIYTLTENNSENYFISGNSKIITADKDAYIESNGMPMKYDLEGSMVSEIKVDKISGWIIEAKMNQDIRGDVYIKSNVQMPNGMKIPMIMKSDIEFTNK